MDTQDGLETWIKQVGEVEALEEELQLLQQFYGLLGISSQYQRVVESLLE